jgi:pilus assembly protein Flp/PilA
MFNTWVSSLRLNSRLIWRILRNENGQDLVEYAAVVVIVVLGLTAGMGTLAAAINNAMTNVGSYLNSVLG